MAWFYNKDLKTRCEIEEVKIIGVLPPLKRGEKTISEIKVKFSSSLGSGELITDSNDVNLAKGLSAYRAEFFKKKHEQLSLFKSMTNKKIVS